MQKQKQKAIVIETLGNPPVYRDFDIPQPAQDQVLIKVIASTINPSDRYRAMGTYGPSKVPFALGLEGYGQIVKVGTPEHQNMVGKKVSFTTMTGSWAQYSVTHVKNVRQIDSDVPISSAASGVINPLTVIGMVDTYLKWNNYGLKPKGMINTAAASSLGRMLNKYCQKFGIPLLNVVRRKEQVKILQNDGAKFIIDTSDEKWIQQYTELLNTHEFNVLFDAIGAGEVTEKLISNLKPCSQVYIYGSLSKQPFTMTKPLKTLQGTSISSFTLFEWFERISTEQKNDIHKQYSSLLKNQLSTNCLKQIKLEDIPNIWQEAEKRATEGKFTIII